MYESKYFGAVYIMFICNKNIVNETKPRYHRGILFSFVLLIGFGGIGELKNRIHMGNQSRGSKRKHGNQAIFYGGGI